MRFMLSQNIVLQVIVEPIAKKGWFDADKFQNRLLVLYNHYSSYQKFSIF